MEKVVAKFQCLSITEFEGGSKEANLQAVYGIGNEDFSNATPSGHLRISISSGVPAVDFFKPGKEYLLEFSSVESK